MPRLARTVVAGCAHHITQRGNNRQDVFFVDDDRHVYLELLREEEGRSLGGMITVLTEAAKGLNEKIEALQAENQTLKAELAQIKRSLVIE